MSVDQLTKETQRRQRAIMRQMTTRLLKIATLQTEVENLRKQLCEVSVDVLDESGLDPVVAVECPECGEENPHVEYNFSRQPWIAIYGCCGAEVADDE